MSLVAGAVIAKFKADVSEMKSGISQAKTEVGSLKNGFGKLNGTLQSFGSAFFSLPALIGGIGMGALAVDTLKAGAQFTRLEGTLKTVAKNVGLTSDEIKGMKQDLEDANLWGATATETLLTFVQSGLGSMTDMKKFTLMAKDYSASIGVSSEQGVKAFTKAIGTLRPELLEQFRIQLNLNEVYGEEADRLGKKVVNMTAQEKRLALLNRLYKEHESTVKGVYVDTYDTAGKAISSIQDFMGALKGYIGQIFEPALQELAVMARNKIKDLTVWFKENQDKVAEWAESAKEATKKFVAGFMTVVKFLIEHKEIIVGFFAVVALSIGAFVVAFLVAHATAIAIIAGLTALIAVFYKAWTENWGGIQEKTRAVVDFLKRMFDAFKQWWDRYGDDITKITKGAWQAIWNIIKYFVDSIISTIKFLWQIVTGDWKGAWETMKRLSERGKGYIGNIFKGLKDVVVGAISGIATYFTEKFEEMWNKAKDIAKKIREAIASAFDKDKRNSPSIADRLREIVDFSQKTLSGVQIPQFSADIADGIRGVAGSLQLNSLQPAGAKVVNQYINAEIKDAMDVDTLAERMAFKFRNEI
jgi:phage-related protein